MQYHAYFLFQLNMKKSELKESQSFKCSQHKVYYFKTVADVRQKLKCENIKQCKPNPNKWSKQRMLPTKHLDTANSEEVTTSESRFCSCLIMSRSKTLDLIVSEF